MGGGAAGPALPPFAGQQSTSAAMISPVSGMFCSVIFCISVTSFSQSTLSTFTVLGRSLRTSAIISSVTPPGADGAGSATSRSMGMALLAGSDTAAAMSSGMAVGGGALEAARGSTTGSSGAAELHGSGQRYLSTSKSTRMRAACAAASVDSAPRLTSRGCESSCAEAMRGGSCHGMPRDTAGGPRPWPPRRATAMPTSAESSPEGDRSVWSRPKEVGMPSLPSASLAALSACTAAMGTMSFSYSRITAREKAGAQDTRRRRRRLAGCWAEAGG
mmetsp:Transcript_26324/g.88206  ORF Transcript_26324/g.88206 Transcript_26324/m.88206 type:complete len:274 (-) Transcript_26324:916-1737(-)